MRNLIIVSVGVICLASAGVAKVGTPEKQIESLVEQLKSEKRGTALQDFFAGTLLEAQKQAYVKAMDAQAGGAWAIYGHPLEYEVSEKTEMGKSLIRIKWITKHKDDMPLFWNALFYRRAGSWEPLTVLFYDDPAKAGF